jgi:hypothetical protein
LHQDFKSYAIARLPEKLSWPIDEDYVARRRGRGGRTKDQVECPTCVGTGAVEDETGKTVECHECDGQGSIESDESGSLLRWLILVR